MRKTTSVLMLLSIPFIGTLNAETISDSLKTNQIKISVYNVADTPFVPLVVENPVTLYQNIVFKTRLDSLESEINLDYNEYVQTFIDVLFVKGKGKISRMLGLSNYYFPIYDKIFQEQGLPAELKFLSIVESELNPFAVSRSGAVGLWQFMYTTAKGYRLQMDSWVDERKDPVASCNAAAAYLRDAYNIYGDWLLAIASYNCGTGCVSRALAKSGGTTFWDIKNILPRETQNYVPAFIATVYLMNYPFNHDISPTASDLDIPTEVLWVNQKISLAGIAKAADLDEKQLHLLNPAYKRKIINGSELSPKRLVIPSVNNDSYTALYRVFNNETASDVQVAAFQPKEAVNGYYKSREGESLQDVADEYDVSVQDLKVWNNLKQPVLVPGQSIRISAPEKKTHSRLHYLTYKVKSGDTLSAIAAKFKGVTVSELKSANRLTRSKLKPGMLLKIVKG